ncbi:MAG: phosphate signaling complex protein PhoU [Gammaproteobacteria bacterium]
MANPSEHIVKSYDEELKHLNTLIGRMGGLVETQLDAAIQAVLRRDAEGADKVVKGDAQVDELETEIEALVVRLLALRQPMAVDLRYIVSALKIAADLERFGDHAKGIAKRAIAISQVPRIPAPGLDRMARMVQHMIKDVLDAYLDNDTNKAIKVWRGDAEVDELYNSLFRELLTYMMEDPRNITGCTHLLFIAKNVERMGDHATNIAETVHYQVKGSKLPDDRPRGDDPSFTIADRSC